MSELIPIFVGGSLTCFLVGYGAGVTYRAVRQIIERASRP